MNVVKDWGEKIAKESNAVAKRSLEEAAKVGAGTAAQLASGRKEHTGKMRDWVTVPTDATGNGWRSGFRSAASMSGEFYSGFQSRGTLASRRGTPSSPGNPGTQVKQQTLARRQSPSGRIRYAKVAGRKGIAPLKHEEQALAVAKQHLLRLLRSRLGAQ